MFTKVGILGFGHKRRLECDTYRRSMNKSGTSESLKYLLITFYV